ncbi:hypothetical protein K438DRAFT_1072421 [Mycena galopus ATCC 62051]|nr:hypothetical protein K438DRAFT_1072421 [Mycena galopus ATCC 62051]
MVLMLASKLGCILGLIAIGCVLHSHCFIVAIHGTSASRDAPVYFPGCSSVSSCWLPASSRSQFLAVFWVWNTYLSLIPLACLLYTLITADLAAALPATHPGRLRGPRPSAPRQAASSCCLTL